MKIYCVRDLNSIPLDRFYVSKQKATEAFENVSDGSLLGIKLRMSLPLKKLIVNILNGVNYIKCAAIIEKKGLQR